MRRPGRLGSAWLVIIGVGAAACGTNGSTSADATGDPSAPTADAHEAATTPEAALDVPPEATPYTEAFEFVKAPWLLNVREDAVTVAWETDVPLTAPTVIVTTAAGERVVTGTSGPLDLSQGPLVGKPPTTFQSRVALTGLEAGAVVSYVVKNAAGDASGTFRTAPPKNASAHLVVYGDTRIDEDAHRRVVEAIAAEAPDLLLHTGDLVHVPTNDALQVFFDVLSLLSADVPLAATLGNHETDLFRGWFLGFLEPPVGFEDGTNTAFAYGPAYVVVVNSLRDPTRDGFAAWFESELTRAQAWPYRFVMFHSPMHTFSNHAPWEEGVEVIEPLLTRHGVTAVFAGHNHCYERFEVDGIPQLTLGGGGAPLYNVETSLVPEEEHLLKADGKFYHYLVLDLTPEAATARVMIVEPENVTEFETFTMAPAF